MGFEEVVGLGLVLEGGREELDRMKLMARPLVPGKSVVRAVYRIDQHYLEDHHLVENQVVQHVDQLVEFIAVSSTPRRSVSNLQQYVVRAGSDCSRLV
jgi:hypothetical protein